MDHDAEPWLCLGAQETKNSMYKAPIHDFLTLGHRILGANADRAIWVFQPPDHRRKLDKFLALENQ